MTMFEMIDELEPIIPQQEMNALNYSRLRVWQHEHPDLYKAIVKRNNDKRTIRKEEQK